MEVFKEMDLESLKEIRDLLNIWWIEEKVPDEMLEARVALIFKKDTSKFENYRPNIAN